MPAKPLVATSVRELVAFVLRTGNLGGTGGFSGRHRALEGTRGHQRLQKQRPEGYTPEVPVSWKVEEETFIFELKGRIDGVLEEIGGVTIEEIKTVRRRIEGEAGPVNAVHWGQAKVYAWIYAQEHSCPEILVRLTYLELPGGETTQFEERLSIETLKAFFDSVLNEYLNWMRAQILWCQQRNESIQAAAFPFEKYREGQRTLAVAVYRAIQQRARLFAEAPTGIGKTVSALFPAIKAMGEGRVEKIFYVTAKTSGRAVAEQTLGKMRQGGLNVRHVTLTARDKICFNNGQPCDLNTCPFAIGYYDRIKAALRCALQFSQFDRAQIEVLARQHQVCPFELSLDLAVWADLIVCDYNYVFDPSVSLKRFFDEEKHDYAILVDEAHNLIDRARAMFSADLVRSQLIDLKNQIKSALPDCARELGKMATRMKSAVKEEGWTERETAWLSKSAPDKVGTAVESFLQEAERWLVTDDPASFREALLETYFQALGFLRTIDLFDERFVTIYEKESERMRLFCLDPSLLLRKALERTGASVFFSATLRPIQFYREALGGEALDATLQLRCPFPRENLCVLINDQISTRFKTRAESYNAVAESIAAVVEARAGNYLVFFPSYAYLSEVRSRFEQRFGHLRVEGQMGGMNELERDEFIGKFQAGTDGTMVGFAVLGGVFGEGIDLVGERLIGVIIVGVGLPQLSLERDLIKESFSFKGNSGFDYAYTFPGMNRVLQAVGRLIRSDSDRGLVLLIDDRFRTPLYRRLFPAWWKAHPVRSVEQIKAAAQRFWTGSQS